MGIVGMISLAAITALIGGALFLVVDAMSTKEKRDKYSLKRGQGRS